MPYSNLALDADRENGPAARSFAADAHDRIMVRIKTILPNTSLWREVASQWRAPLGSYAHWQPDAELHRKALLAFIIPPRAQASRRCETQASLGGQAAKLC
jgi:hypothetical protein